MKRGLIVALGFAAFTILQCAWSAGHAMLGWKGAWVMKGGPGIGVSFVLFAGLGAAVVAFRFKPADLSRRILWLLGGAVLAMIAALLVVGAGNLWPLVVAFDGAILAGAAFFGAVIGGAIGRRRVPAS